MSPAITVITVTYQSRAHFPRLRAALEAQTCAFDLIVLDSASSVEQRPTLADFPRARLIQSETNLGFAAGNNRAAESVATPFIALLNPDAFPEPDWLASLLQAAAQFPEAGVFGSTQVSALDEDKFDGVGDPYFAAGASWRGGHGARRTFAPKAGESFSVCAAAALVRTPLWRALGGFDVRLFSYCEDVDLCFRVRLAGWRVRQVPNAVVRHIGGASATPRSDFAAFHAARNRIWVFVKNMPGALFWTLAPAHLALTLYQLASGAVRGQGGATLRGVRAALDGLPATWRARAEIQRQRRASLSSIAAAMTWSPLKMLQRAPDIRP